MAADIAGDDAEPKLSTFEVVARRASQLKARALVLTSH